MSVRTPRLLFREAFKWEGTVEEFVKSRINGRSMNVRCGQSTLGDVRVDIEPSVNPSMVADLLKMDLSTKYQTVISDPPWHINPFHRRKWFFRVVDLCEVGGRIIYNAPWIPESKAVELEEMFIRKSAYFGNVSLLMTFKKINAFTRDKAA